MIQEAVNRTLSLASILKSIGESKQQEELAYEAKQSQISANKALAESRNARAEELKKRTENASVLTTAKVNKIKDSGELQKKILNERLKQEKLKTNGNGEQTQGAEKAKRNLLDFAGVRVTTNNAINTRYNILIGANKQ